MSCSVVKVLLNKDANVMESVSVSVGTYLRVRTWTLLVFLLNALSHVVLGGDEEPLLMDGPVPSWMAPQGGIMGHGSPHDEAFGNVSSAASDNVHDLEYDVHMAIPEEGNVVSMETGVVVDVVPPMRSPFWTLLVVGNASDKFFSNASTDFAAFGGVKSPPPSPKGPSFRANKVVTGLDEVVHKTSDLRVDDDVELCIISKEEAISVPHRKMHRARMLSGPICSKFLRCSSRSIKWWTRKLL
ncbi:unnamed protein product [Urochloa humidicola]